MFAHANESLPLEGKVSSECETDESNCLGNSDNKPLALLRVEMRSIR